MKAPHKEAACFPALAWWHDNSSSRICPWSSPLPWPPGYQVHILSPQTLVLCVSHKRVTNKPDTGLLNSDSKAPHNDL